MNRFITTESAVPSPESTFASKYTWLLRWALYFAQNDRHAAEDLVQETFVLMLLKWEDLEDTHNLEPFLYSHLRYAHLTERRRNRNYSLQSLSTIDADHIAASLRSTSSFEQIEIQDELRSILSFLLWKRKTTKFASIFLLRFFHGYFPEEIALICRSSRHSVDLGLRHARAELKTYFLDPGAKQHLQVASMPHSAGPDSKDQAAVMPAHEFADSLSQQVVAKLTESCPTRGTLDRCYADNSTRAIEPELLGHIVTCRSCLRQVTELCRIVSRSTRSLDETLNSAPRKKNPDRAAVQKDHTQHPKAIMSVAVTLSLAFTLLFWNKFHQPTPQLAFENSLERSVQAEGKGSIDRPSEFIHQRITITVAGKTRYRDLYRDSAARRKRKISPPDHEEQLLREKLAKAQLDWNNPLSSSNFKHWHDHLSYPVDQVDKTSNQLLTFITLSQTGPVRSESLTVRADDWHPVASSLVLDNNERVDIAEVLYQEEPWSLQANQWFEPIKTTLKPVGTRSQAAPIMPVTELSEAAIDITSLSTMIALQDLHAETERLELVRKPGWVEISGVVDTESRKLQIVDRLRTISNLRIRIATYKELDENLGLSSSIHTIKAVSVVSGESRLEKHCIVAHISGTQCRNFSYRLLRDSTTLALESKRLAELDAQYSERKNLTSTARELLAELVNGHIDHLTTALRDQEAVSAMLSSTVSTVGPIEGVDQSSGSSLTKAVESNQAFTHELVYAGPVYPSPDQTEETATLLSNLSVSNKQLQQAIAHRSTSLANAALASFATPTQR